MNIGLENSFKATLTIANKVEPLTLGMLKLASLNEDWGPTVRKLTTVTVPIDHVIKTIAVPFIEIAEYFRDLVNEQTLGIKILKCIVTPIWLPIRVAVKTACFAIYFFTIGLQLPYERLKEILKFEDPKNSYQETMDQMDIKPESKEEPQNVIESEISVKNETSKVIVEDSLPSLPTSTNPALANLLKDLKQEAHPDFADMFDVLFKHFDPFLLTGWENSEGNYTGLLTNAMKVWIPLSKDIKGGGVLVMGDTIDHKVSVSLSQNSIKIKKGLYFWCRIPFVGMRTASLSELKRLEDGSIQIQIEVDILPGTRKTFKPKLGKRDSLLKDWSRGIPLQDNIKPDQFLNQKIAEQAET